jgi:hypothetical protein
MHCQGERLQGSMTRERLVETREVRLTCKTPRTTEQILGGMLP